MQKRLGLYCLLILSLFSPMTEAMKFPSLDHGLIGLAQRKRDFSTEHRVLYVTQRPGDEDLATLAWLRRGLGVQTTVVFATWGTIPRGPDEFPDESLPLFHYREALQAAERTGHEIRCLNLRDPGYTKTREEADAIWQAGIAIRQLASLIREIRPHVVLTNLRREGDTGSEMVFRSFLEEALRNAASIGREFGENPPWTVEYFLEEDGLSGVFQIPLFLHDPLWGVRYVDIARVAARAYGISDSPSIGADTGYSPAPGGPGTSSPQNLLPEENFLNELETLAREGGMSARLSDFIHSATQFLQTPIENPLALVSAAARTRLELEHLGKALESGNLLSATSSLRGKMDWKINALENLMAEGMGLRLSAEYRPARVVPGGTFELEIRIYGGIDPALRGVQLSTNLPGSWSILDATSIRLSPSGESFHPSRTIPAWDDEGIRFSRIGLAAGEELIASWIIHVATATMTDQDPVETLRMMGDPTPPEFTVRAEALLLQQSPLVLEVPIRLNLVPHVEVRILPEFPVLAIPSRRPFHITLEITNNQTQTIRGLASLDPSTLLGCNIRRQEEPVVTIPPMGTASVLYQLETASARRGPTFLRGGFGWVPDEGRGFKPQDFLNMLSSIGSTRFTNVWVLVSGNPSVGLIGGKEDSHVFRALRALNVTVSRIPESEFQSLYLREFDAVLLEENAYHHFPGLLRDPERILRYASAGGNLIVLRQDPRFWGEKCAPLPFSISEPVTLPAEPSIQSASHALLQRPNPISSENLARYIGNMVIRFPMDVPEGYGTPLCLETESRDSHPLILSSRFENGAYTYVSIPLEQKLAEQEETAYHLLTNLLAKIPPQER